MTIEERGGGRRKGVSASVHIFGSSGTTRSRERLPYFWVPLNKRHATYRIFGYNVNEETPEKSRWPLVDEDADDKVSPADAGRRQG